MDGEEQIKKAYESILMHDFEQAVEWFGRAIAMNPHNAAFHYKLSITYARSNKLNNAIEHARQAVKMDSRETTYRLHLQNLQAKAFILKAERHLTENEAQLWLAVSLLKHAIELDSLCLEAYLLLGHGYAMLKEYDQATNAMHTLLELDPQHELGRRLLLEYQQRLRNKNNDSNER